MKRKILYLHRTQGKGAEGSHIRGMVDAFRASGHLDIIGPPGVDPYANQELPEKNAKKNYLKKILSWLADTTPQIIFEMLELAYNVYIFPTIRRKLQHGHYDFIYERYALNTFAGTLLAKHYNIPLVLEVNDATVIERSRPLKLKRMAAKLERLIFSEARLIITISNTFKQLIVQHHNIDVAKILVLPNAINLESFELDPAKCIGREELGIRDDQIVLGCAGAFVPWHGLEFFIEALHDLIKGEDLFVLFIGDGPVRPNIEALAQNYGISANIHFTGFIDASKVPYYLQLIDICIIPDSNRHGSPMKLFECMGAGKPIILPDYPPLLESIKNNIEGLFFRKKNPDDLKRCVEGLIRNPTKRSYLGTNAFNAVKKRFTWEHNARRVLKKIV